MRGVPLEAMLQRCNQQLASDSMVLFLRAVTAMKFSNVPDNFVGWSWDACRVLGVPFE